MERKHKHILETARAIRFQNCLPLKFWGYYIEAAVYTINRIPSSVLKHKSPFELLYGHTSYLSHMRIIDCLCYATTLPRQDKFAPRVVKCALLGYGTHQKGYKLYNLITKSVFISRDVVFYEDIFPFQSSISPANDTKVPFFFPIHQELIKLLILSMIILILSLQ